jgi:pimeloyl-ACP methyl ester carboxylesterase
VALLDALDIARAHVIGHDWGGFAGFHSGCIILSGLVGCCCAIRPVRGRG